MMKRPFMMVVLLLGIICFGILKARINLDIVFSQSDNDVTYVSVTYDPNITEYSDTNEVYSLVKQAIEQLNTHDPQDPLSNLVDPGDVVVLKPNLVGAQRIAFEGCTRTAVLRPIVELAAKAGASKVVIAEGPADPDLNDEVFLSLNIDDLVQEMQTKYPTISILYQNINKDNWTWVDLAEYSTFHGVYTPQDLYSYREIRMDQNSYYHAPDSEGYNPHGYKPGLYAISNTILEADVFINVPKMKVHMITGVTMSLKNLIGITVSDTENATNQEDIKDVPHWNTSYSHRGEDKERIDTFENDVIWRVNADLHKIAFYADKEGNLQPTKQRKYLSVLDGIIGMEGPLIYDETPDPRPTGAIVAGEDPVAVDMVGCRIMGFNCSVIPSVTNMAEVSDHTFGTTDTYNICVLGTSLNSEAFNESYVPHINYENDQIQPYKIRLEHFDPPEIEIKVCPEQPREDREIKVKACANVSLFAAGWLRYSLDDAGPIILKMTPEAECLSAQIGQLEGGLTVSFDVCVQDRYINTIWSEKTQALVAYIKVFNILLDAAEYNVTILSISTIEDFDFSEASKQISFNITGPSGTTGFCNVTIPDNLLWGVFSVYKNNIRLAEGVDYAQEHNNTHYLFHITYAHTTHTIRIMASQIIQEFPLYLIPPLIALATALTVLIFKRRQLWRNI